MKKHRTPEISRLPRGAQCSSSYTEEQSHTQCALSKQEALSHTPAKIIPDLWSHASPYQTDEQVHIHRETHPVHAGTNNTQSTIHMNSSHTQYHTY